MKRTTYHKTRCWCWSWSWLIKAWYRLLKEKVLSLILPWKMFERKRMRQGKGKRKRTRKMKRNRTRKKKRTNTRKRGGELNCLRPLSLLPQTSRSLTPLVSRMSRLAIHTTPSRPSPHSGRISTRLKVWRQAPCSYLPSVPQRPTSLPFTGRSRNNIQMSNGKKIDIVNC